VSDSVALRAIAAEGWALGPACALKSAGARLSSAVLVLAFCAVTVGGCTPRSTAAGARMSSSANSAPRGRPAWKAAIRLPDQALLQRQPEPDCAFRGPLSNPVTAEETRMKLDYEQQCYRQAEVIVRARLQQLQDSVHETIKTIRQDDPTSSGR